MKTTIDSKIGDKGPWADGVRRANQILEMILDTRAADSAIILGNAAVHWDLVRGQRGGPQIALSLSDSYASVETKFDPEELADSEKIWSRLRLFWSDFLRARNGKLLERLSEPAEAATGDA